MNKRIIIKHIGIIHCLKDTLGPILSPILLNEKDVRDLICYSRVPHVFEVLPDGTEVELNEFNYNKDNSKKAKPVMETKVEEPMVKPEPVKVEVREETEEVPVQPENKQKNNPNQNKQKNK